MTTAAAQQTERSNRILTFMLGDTRYAIDISSILSITDDFDRIESAKNHQASFLGYLYYRNKPVSSYECSALLGRDSYRDKLAVAIESLNQSEEAHIAWLAELEQSISHNSAFNAPRDSQSCGFSQWLKQQKNTSDEATKTILDRFKIPHEEFHKQANTLLKVASTMGKEAALNQFSEANSGRSNELIRLFGYTKSQLKLAVHPVVLYITRDGMTPWFALVLDSMDDIVSYEDQQFTQMREPNNFSTQVHPDPVYGYVHNSETDEQDSLVLSAARLAYLIEH